MASTALVPADEVDKGAIELIVELERTGALTKTSLELPADLPFDTWIAMGRFLGTIYRSSMWLIGDWIVAGEDRYGEADSSQGFDDIQSRYQEAERVTGLDHGTMMNAASICRNVKKRQRKEPLGFWIHAEVAKLPAKEQSAWLSQAVKGSWTRADLRRALRAGEAPPADEDGDGDNNKPPDGLTQCERIEAAAEAVWAAGERAENSISVVSLEAWARLEEALGKE